MCVFPGGLSSCTDSSIILQCLFFYGPLRVDVRVFGLAKASRHLGHGVPLVAPAAKAQGE